jgi:hypothetical protein
MLHAASGDEGTRTPDFRLAKAALSQLSYIPIIFPGVVGLTGFEPVTPALSAQCSNQLSYRPILNKVSICSSGLPVVRPGKPQSTSIVKRPQQLRSGKK